MTEAPKRIWAFPYTMFNPEGGGYWCIHERKDCRSVPYIQAEIADGMLVALKEAFAALRDNGYDKGGSDGVHDTVAAAIAKAAPPLRFGFLQTPPGPS